MNIVSGKYRHRKLLTNPGQITRPILARVKVALFDKLQSRLEDKRVADIFAGTGTLGSGDDVSRCVNVAVAPPSLGSRRAVSAAVSSSCMVAISVRSAGAEPEGIVVAGVIG